MELLLVCYVVVGGDCIPGWFVLKLFTFIFTRLHLYGSYCSGIVITTNFRRERPALDHENTLDQAWPVGAMPYTVLDPDKMVWLCYIMLHRCYTFRAALTKRHRAARSCPKVKCA